MSPVKLRPCGPLVAVIFLPLVVTDDVCNGDPSVRPDVIADLMSFIKWRDVIFIYDDSLCAAKRQQLLSDLAENHVGTVTLHLTTSYHDVITSLVEAVQTTIVTSVMMCINSTTAVRFLQEIKKGDMLYRGNEWLVLCAGSELPTIQDFLCCDPSNVATLVPVRTLVPFTPHTVEEGAGAHTHSQACLPLNVTTGTGTNDAFSQLSGPRPHSFLVCIYNYHTNLFERVASWTPKTRLNMESDVIFPDVFNRFNNATLRIGVREAEPFLTKVPNKNGTLNYTGFCMDILAEMARYLSFNYKLVEPPDGMYGAPDANNTWNGMMGMLIRGELEMAIGPFSISPERQAVVDFTVPYMEDGGGILTKGGEPKPDLLGVFRPFPLGVWLMMAAAVVVTAVVLYWIIKLSSLRCFSCGDGQNQQHQQDWTLEECWVVIYGSLMSQGVARHPVPTAGRMVLGFWWVFTILILSIYTASLAAQLTVRIKEDHIESIHDLADSSVDPVTLVGTNWWTLFMKADKGVYKVIGDRMRASPNVTRVGQALELVHSDSAAFIMDTNQINYLYGIDCKKLHMASTIFNNNGLGFALPKRAYYKDALSRIILKLQEGGFVETWKQRWWRKSPECDTDKPSVSPSRRLEVVSIGGILIFYATVIVLSILCLVAEWIRHGLGSHHRKTRSREEQREGFSSCAAGCSSYDDCDDDGDSETSGRRGRRQTTAPKLALTVPAMGSLRNSQLVWRASLFDNDGDLALPSTNL